MLKLAAVRRALPVPAAILATALIATSAFSQEPSAAPATEAAPAAEAAPAGDAAPAVDAAPVAAAEGAGPAATAAEGEAAAEGGEHEAVHWNHWTAGNEINNIGSLQRGARNFMSYCAGCHSLKYSRYSRVGKDLSIPDDQLDEFLVLPGDNKNGYMLTTLSAADGEAWFGKTPPDLSLITRARGTDYVFQFLKTFYADPNTATGVNNLALPGTAMPHVLAELEGVKAGVFREVPVPASGDQPASTKVEFVRFEDHVPGKLSPAEYDEFLRDTVNFLDYVGEPAKAQRVSLGVWVVLFLLAFTGIAYLLKLEYWKDVK
jgi:ubiquinol-cytochrome c reductase cytochrome c1 subunit